MLTRLLHDRRGGVAVAFALSLLPALSVAGIAVDYTHIAGVRPQIQALLDRAVLTAVTSETELDREAYAGQLVSAQAAALPEGVVVTNVVPTYAPDPQTGAHRLRVSADVRVDTRFARVLGYDDVAFTLDAEAVSSDNRYEVVLVVDVTGSMKGGKINALRESARRFVETLLPTGSESDRIRVAVVPYSATVNVGTDEREWLHPAPGGLAAIVQNRYVWDASEVAESDCGGTDVTWDDDLDLCHLGTLSEWEEPGPCPGVARDGTCWVADGWAGCVMERAGTAEELTDAPPATAAFRPYYWPSWEGAGGARSTRFNSYLPNDIDQSRATNAFSNDGLGPNLGCPQNPVVPFTDDRVALLAEIDGFEAWHRGGTMGHVGMLWGWRMLSPLWEEAWGADPWAGVESTSDVEQIVVFMTDGANGFYTGHAPSGDSDYTAYGRMSDTPDFSPSNHKAALDTRMESVCESLRGAGVEVFTVGFALSDAKAQELLGDCASSPSHVFASEVDTLVAHFEAIARDIYDRRAALTD